MSITEELTAAAELVRSRVGPATVRIGRHGGRGAGVVVADGAVVTNAHNLRGPSVTVTFADGRVATGTVTAADSAGDLAVIGVDTAGVAPVVWSDTAPVLGAPVWTVTLAPDGGHRVTSGAVSGVGSAFRGPGGHPMPASIEHTAPLPRGSSGGPLVDAGAAVVGLNTHRLGDGFYLSLPADAELQGRIAALAAGQTPTRRRLGVALAPPGAAAKLRAAVGLDERDGLLVRDVDPEGPAGRAGIRRGDLIVRVGGRATATPDDLFAALATDATTLGVTVVRGVSESDLTVEFGPVGEPDGGD